MKMNGCCCCWWWWWWCEKLSAFNSPGGCFFRGGNFKLEFTIFNFGSFFFDFGSFFFNFGSSFFEFSLFFFKLCDCFFDLGGLLLDCDFQLSYFFRCFCKKIGRASCRGRGEILVV